MANALQDHYAAILLEKISHDRHPSTTQMDMLEAVASERLLAAHILGLIERIENEDRPSIPMMQRVQRLVALFDG